MSDRPATDRSGADRSGEGTLVELVRAAGQGPRTLDSVRQRITRTHRLTASYLSVGFIAITVSLVVRGLASFLWALNDRSATWLSGLSWVLVLAALAVGVLTAVSRHGELPGSVLAGVLAVDTAALLLEFADYALPAPAPLYYPTVCIGVGATVLALLGFQPLSRSTLAIALLVGLSVLGMLAQALLADAGSSIAVGNVLLATTPVAVYAALLTALDRHVHRGLDRTLADSVIDGPGTGPGSLAASELARVDAEIAELLEEVVRRDAEGAAPLDAALGERARTLGDELRAVLAARHDHTWLRIAVEESALLSEAVVVRDPQGIAAELAPPDRSRLLSVLWLLTAQERAGRPAVELALARGSGPADPMRLILGAPGLRPRDVDPAVWGILGEIGVHRVSAESPGTTIELHHRPPGRPA
ncbi:hypothetical protein [Rathayibacter sp. VKM Ac-2760]|uniref:hypothetical protein n=1 Tax=Rathayibacter sp. VKM Ac-2760 TaxID=2609253 RepID=UPI001316DF2C|nr:hypothetical protein [Rathayibacter sp. VKM Ac-2760]QHC59993.1 hypothetical protein GSU72_16635 [Rathayibacter sp. VKM Ac-2760]